MQIQYVVDNRIKQCVHCYLPFIIEIDTDNYICDSCLRSIPEGRSNFLDGVKMEIFIDES